MSKIRKIIPAFPPTFILKGKPSDYGFNAQNLPLWINLVESAPQPAAVWAQERWEWGFKWRKGLAYASPLIAATATLVVMGDYAYAFATGMLGLATAIWSPRLHQREMELGGHAIEIAASVELYGEDYEVALSREVASLTKYSVFRNLTKVCIGWKLKNRGRWAQKEFVKLFQPTMAIKNEIEEAEAAWNQRAS